MSNLTIKEVSNKLLKLSERLDSTLIVNHLQLTIYDVRFLKDLANSLKKQLFIGFELEGFSDNYIWRE